MRFLHTADLHIGKLLHQHSLLSDQKLILQQILDIAQAEQVDAVLIAGDVYQRNNPSPEAMALFGRFLSQLAERKLPCYVISGNHDSALRIAYLSELASLSGIYIAGTEPGAIYSFPVQDAHGELIVHLLSYCTPLAARQCFPELAGQIFTYEDALRAVLHAHPVDKSQRNVLVCHQFLTSASTCDSEELAIGGLDNISASLFDDYDYVALGHLHGAQYVQRETVRYAGSPLKYSFSEVTQRKSVVIADLAEKGSVEIRTVPLRQPHEMQVLTGSFAELSEMPRTEDYVRVILTEELPPQDAARILRSNFPNMLQCTVQNSKMRDSRSTDAAENPMQSDFLTLLREFYAYQNQGASLTEMQEELVRQLTETLDREAGDA